MGIRGLYDRFRHDFRHHQRYVFKAYNIVDFNNILYQKLLYTKYTQMVTPLTKVQHILQLCEMFDKYPDKQFYIVIDPTGNQHKNVSFDFEKYNQELAPRKLVYDAEQCTIQLLDEKGEITKKLNVRKIKGEKNKKVNKINVKQTNQQILKIPLYNNVIVQKYFEGSNHVHVINSRFEADMQIGIIVDRLLQKNIDKKQITIISRDSDMICYSKGVLVQSEQYEFNIPGIKHPEHLFICGSTYLDPLISLDKFIQNQGVYEEIRQKQMQDGNLNFIFSEMIYVKYECIIQKKPEAWELGIKTLSEAIMYSIIYLQKILQQKTMQYEEIRSLPIFSTISDEQFDMSFRDSLNNLFWTTEIRGQEREIWEEYKTIYPQYFTEERLAYMTEEDKHEKLEKIEEQEEEKEEELPAVQ